MAKKQNNFILDTNLFNPVYLPYLNDYSKRYNIYYGGRASGKSYFIVDKLVIKGLKSKRRMLFLMKQTNKVQDTIWQLTLDALIKFQIYEKCKINKSNFTIELPNGTWIKMTGLDEPEKIKAYVNISDIWLEEATNFNTDDFELIDGTVRGQAEHKQIYLSFNPVSKLNWVYRYWCFDTNTIPKNTFILKTTYKDNKFCDSATIARLEALKEKNPARYKIEAEGDFATLDKLVYSYTIGDFNYKEILQQKNATALFGLDFGYVNDPTFFIGSIVDEDNKKLYIFMEHSQRGMLNNEIASMIKDKGFAKEIIIADSAERKSVEEIRRLGISRIKPARKGQGSIMIGIQKIKQYEIIVHSSCTNIIDELDNYSYEKDKSTGEYLNKPIDTWNHGLDALRYSIQALKKKVKIFTVKL